jgi:6 kDa early secretory antigenic target
MTAYSVDADQLFSATAAVRGTADRLQGETGAMLSQLTQL